LDKIVFSVTCYDNPLGGARGRGSELASPGWSSEKSSVGKVVIQIRHSCRVVTINDILMHRLATSPEAGINCRILPDRTRHL